MKQLDYEGFNREVMDITVNRTKISDKVVYQAFVSAKKLIITDVPHSLYPRLDQNNEIDGFKIEIRDEDQWLSFPNIE